MANNEHVSWQSRERVSGRLTAHNYKSLIHTGHLREAYR